MLFSVFLVLVYFVVVVVVIVVDAVFIVLFFSCPTETQVCDHHVRVYSNEGDLNI